MKKQAKPNFFIMGPSAGSSSMYYYLKNHPEIFMCPVKEPLYFRKDLKPRGNLKSKYRKWEDYLQLFKDVKDEKIIGEATPTYLYSDVALNEIKKKIGKPKILIMLRNPVDFVVSLHHYAVIGGYENIKDFEKALDAEKQRIKGRKNPQITSEKEMIYYTYLLRKIYQNVGKCMKTFGKKNVMVVLQDDLKKDIENTYKNILAFLGVSPLFKPNFKKRNVHKDIRSRTLMKTIRKTEKLPSGFIRAIKIIFPRKIRNSVRDFNIKKGVKKKVDVKIEKRLKKEFHKDIIKLGKTINRDLKFWIK